MATANTEFVIHDYEEKPKPGKYDAQVAALADANRKSLAAGGKKKAIDIPVPTADLAKEKRAFQLSAKNYRSEDAPDGYTGRADIEEDQGDGMTVVSFILVDRIKKPRGGSNDTPLEDTPAA